MFEWCQKFKEDHDRVRDKECPAAYGTKENKTPSAAPTGKYCMIPPYSPDLSPRDFHVFGLLKRALQERYLVKMHSAYGLISSKRTSTRQK